MDTDVDRDFLIPTFLWLTNHSGLSLREIATRVGIQESVLEAFGSGRPMNAELTERLTDYLRREPAVIDLAGKNNRQCVLCNPNFKPDPARCNAQRLRDAFANPQLQSYQGAYLRKWICKVCLHRERSTVALWEEIQESKRNERRQREENRRKEFQIANRSRSEEYFQAEAEAEAAKTKRKAERRAKFAKVLYRGRKAPKVRWNKRYPLRSIRRIYVGSDGCVAMGGMMRIEGSVRVGRRILILQDHHIHAANVEQVWGQINADIILQKFSYSIPVQELINCDPFNSCWAILGELASQDPQEQLIFEQHFTWPESIDQKLIDFPDHEP